MDAQREQPQSWIGRGETIEDTVDPTPAVALTVMLDHPAAPVVASTVTHSEVRHFRAPGTGTRRPW
ncbi:hypothetical protein ACSFA7_02635 [Variovorax sp. LT1R20]|uniref:hypothetical protein n=1 Tax=Variovorax sp. LT1R20 TaxID=3443729 RepID=UPI003F489137